MAEQMLNRPVLFSTVQQLYLSAHFFYNGLYFDEYELGKIFNAVSKYQPFNMASSKFCPFTSVKPKEDGGSAKNKRAQKRRALKKKRKSSLFPPFAL
jgi:hypothetical protein